ncbi:MAG: hypothetical protein HYX24_05800 [Candidatus Aenigmarchaeota archaeon]|nr:hypothetical protein [Candidatus Aenigmarchaeota archaeon]
MTENASRGQTNMIIAVVAIAVFVSVAVFLFSALKAPPNSEYINVYSHNLLISVLRADTGYLDSACKTVEDAITCVYTEPITYLCDSSIGCRKLAEDKIAEYMSKNTFLGRKYRYLFNVGLEGKPSSPGSILNFGDSRLEREKIEKTSADVTIQKITRSGKALTFNVKLMLATEK